MQSMTKNEKLYIVFLSFQTFGEKKPSKIFPYNGNLMKCILIRFYILYAENIKQITVSGIKIYVKTS